MGTENIGAYAVSIALVIVMVLNSPLWFGLLMLAEFGVLGLVSLAIGSSIGE